DRNLNIHMPEVLPPKTLYNVQRLRSGLACLIEPVFSLETFCLDDQCVAFRLAGGITQPGGSKVCSQRAPIQEDLPPHVGGFIQNDNEIRTLDDLPGWRRSIDPGHALRQAVGNRILPRMGSVQALIE